MYLFINGTQRRYIRNSIRITDELQERVNTASFNLDAGFSVNYYEDVKIYQGAQIVSLSATNLVIDREYYNDLFYPGAEIWLGLGLSTEEKVTIASVDGVNITLTSNAENSHSADELMGVKKFAGVVVDIDDFNIRLLKNLEFQITCADYTTLFDKQLINESYEDRDARYIVNNFCNQFINRNLELDDITYDNTTALQAVWTVFNSTLTLDTSDYRETTGAMKLSYTGGSTFEAPYRDFSPALDFSSYTGTTTANAARGVLAFWIKVSDHTNFTANTFQVTFIDSGGKNWGISGGITIVEVSNEWVFVEIPLPVFESGSSPKADWSAIISVTFVWTYGGDCDVWIDGIRILEDEFFRHYPYVEESLSFSDFNIPRVKPIEVMQRLADELAWFWYIDYDRNIRLFSQEVNEAPFSLTETSDNFSELSIGIDISKLVNRQVVKGSDEVSDSVYSQVVEGDGIVREWLMKTKFKNLVVSLDNNSSTDTMESGTTTTTVNATAHGLEIGDYIVNRTRNNAVRKVLTVPGPNSFTVLAVTSQTNGDVFSKFVEQNVGVEGINLDTGNDFMSNFNEKSIRNAEDQPTLGTGEFLLFEYNEVVPILVQRRNNTSIANIQSILGYTNGIKDGAPIVDRTIKTRAEATALAEAQLNKYSNAIIKATFRTTFEGLESGQLIRITDTTSSTRNIDQDFMIQVVKLREVEDGENIYTVTCSSSLFGIMELFQQLLKQGRKLEVDEDAKIEKIEDVVEIINQDDSVASAVNDNLLPESLSIAESPASTLFTPPYKWGPDANQGRWNLAEWD